MPTIVVPTTAQLQQAHNNPTSLLAMYQAAQQPTPMAGSPAAVTAAGTGVGTQPKLNELNNPDWLKSMTEMINQLNTQAQQAANAARIPGAAGMEKQSSANIGSMLQGNVPADVYREMAQRSAERGVSTGSPMGANSTADIMRALGLTSLDMTNQGQKLLTEAYGRNPAAPIANTQALVTTPAQAEALRLQQQNMELDYLARMAAVNAARDRTAAGYGRGGGGGGSFAPATNWNQVPTQTASPTPITQPWHLPYTIGGGDQISDTDWNDLLYGYPGQDFTPQTPTPTPTPYPDYGGGVPDWNNLLPPMSPDYTGPGLSDEELFNLYGG